MYSLPFTLILTSIFFFLSNPGSVVKTYFDDLPPDASVLQSYAHVIGSFNCNPPSDVYQQRIRLMLNDNYVDKEGIVLPNTGGCACENCGASATFTISAVDMNTHYFSTLPNAFRVVVPNYAVNSNYLCLSRLIVDVHFSVPDPVVSYILPVAGPAAGGGTNITVHGDHFSPYMQQYCVFGNVTQSLLLLFGGGSSNGTSNNNNNNNNNNFSRNSGVFIGGSGYVGSGGGGDDDYVLAPATYISSTKLVCTVPDLSMWVDSAVEVRLATSVYDEMFYTPSTAAAYFMPYKELRLGKVRPARGSVRGNIRVTLSGTFSSAGFPRCLFRSGSAAHTVSGVRDGPGHVVCASPAWERPEAAEVSVSINGQQFSNALPFAFVGERLVSIGAFVAIAVAAGVSVLVVLGVWAVWHRHRRALDGYNKIDSGAAQIDMRDIELGERIGRGTFGEVFKGTWRGAVVAVKKMRMDKADANFAAEFEGEVSLMKALRSPNILQYLGSAFSPPDVCIITEYMARGSLHGILHNKAAVLDWPLRLHVLSDAARGMLYLHTSRPPIIHRDLKSHNLLVDEFWRVKVCDFGLSTVIEQGSQTMTACGTPCWTAPEVLRREHYTTQADVYSFGIVMWECLTRADPYIGIPPYKVICAVGKKGLRPQVPSWAPKPYVRLMCRCWDDDQLKRPDFAEVLSDIDEMAHLGWTGQPGPSSSSSSSMMKGDGNVNNSTINNDINNNSNNKRPSAPAKLGETSEVLVSSVSTNGGTTQSQESNSRIKTTVTSSNYTTGNTYDDDDDVVESSDNSNDERFTDGDDSDSDSDYSGISSGIGSDYTDSMRQSLLGRK